MKFTTVYLDDNKIELFNSILGKETVKVNNVVVSKIFSFLGAEHHFNIKENGNDIPCKLVTGFGINGTVIDLYKDKKPIIESPKNGCLGFLMIIFFVIVILRGIDYFLDKFI